MTQEQINTLATVTNRYAKLNIAAQDARKAIQNVTFELFEGVVNEGQIEVLKKAEKILEEIYGNTSVRDAIKHFNTL